MKLYCGIDLHSNNNVPVVIDEDDNIWVLNRPGSISGDEANAEADPAISECCVRPPAVLKFDQEGNLLASWGTDNYVEGWPIAAHTIFTDSDGNVWIGGSQAGDTLLKFTPDGQLISDFGHRGPRFEGPAREQPQDNQQTDVLLRGTASACSGLSINSRSNVGYRNWS